MAETELVCEACGDTLAVVDNTQAEPALRLAAGLAFHAEGSAACPGCGHGTRINFNILQKLIPSGPLAH